MKLINNINIIIGLWLSAIYIYIFYVLQEGGRLAVLHHVEATTEMILAIILSLWFAWQIPYQIIKRKPM